MIVDKLSPGIWIALYATITLAKVLFIFLGGGVETFGFGGGNDADYYDASALQQGEYAVNMWPILLSFLVDHDFYSRAGVANFLMFISFIVIPFLVFRLSIINIAGFFGGGIWFAFLIVGVYPALFFYSLDIYRDVFMVLVFLTGLFAVKRLAEKNSILVKFSWFVFGVCLSYVLLGLRGYLGVAYFLTLFVAVFGYSLISFVKKLNLFSVATIYLFIVYLFYFFGLFEALIQYRAGFQEGSGGTTFGLRFDNFLLFFPNFILSWLFQIFGVWLLTPLAVVLFFCESLPFLIIFNYVVRNRKFISSFGWSIIFFFIAYNTVWLIGNDNLGTAWRLRIYSYLSIFIVFLEIYQFKNKLFQCKF